MKGGAASRVAWGACSVGIALGVAYAVLLALNGGGVARDSVVVRAMLLVFIFALSSCGALVSSHRPRNPIGWLLLVGALSTAIWGVAYEYALHGVIVAPGSLPGTTVAAWLQGWAWAPLFVMIAPGLALFPDGRLPSKRWRPVVWMSALAFVLGTVGAATVTGPLLEGEYIENPLGVGAFTSGELVWLIVTSLAVGGSALAPIVRFRRAGPVERQQLKWLALSGFAYAVAFPAVVVFDSSDGIARDLSSLVYEVVLLAFPITITLAILRYGLYDIDVIINRTLVYGLLTASTVASYLFLVVTFGWLVRLASGQGSSELAVAATTLVVAALFQPARLWIQAAVDRRFYRARYDATRTLEAFQARLRDEPDLESLCRETLRVVEATVRPSSAQIWLRGTGGMQVDENLVAP